MEGVVGEWRGMDSAVEEAVEFELTGAGSTAREGRVLWRRGRGERREWGSWSMLWVACWRARTYCWHNPHLENKGRVIS